VGRVSHPRWQRGISRQNNTVVTGTIATSVTLALPDLASCHATFPAPTQSIDLQPGQTLVLAPGSYGSTSIKSRATLKLSAGTYELQSLGLEPQSTVVLDTSLGPVFLLVQGDLIDRGRFITPAGAVASAMLFDFGQNRATIEVPFQGLLVVPNRALGLAASGMTYGGAFYAKDIEVSPRASVVHAATF
jgi:hypothetical protein